MKKLLIKMLLIAFINRLISATPRNPYLVKLTENTSTEKPQKLSVMEEIHPLYILEYRFN